MLNRRPVMLAVCALLAAAGLCPRAARAATAVRLQTAGDLPFTPDELEQAVGARLAMSADRSAILVIVGPADDTGVQVRMGDRQVAVAVGAHVGLAAARVVALEIAELAVDAADQAQADQQEDDGEEADGARPPPEVMAQTGAPAIAAPAAAASPAPAAGGTRISVAFGGLKGMDDDAEPYTWSAEADAAFPALGHDLIAGLGVWDVPSMHAGRPDQVSFLSGVVRAGMGWRSGPAQLTVGPFVAPYRIEGTTIHHTGLLVGGGAMVRMGYRFALAGVEVFASVRVDAFANRVHIASTSPTPTFATPYLATSVALGVGWDLGI